MKYCSNCGTKNSQNDIYCSSCGRALKKSVLKKSNNDSSIIKENFSYTEVYKHVLQNYFNCNGRASRKEYWTFTLMSFALIFIISFIENLFILDYSSDEGFFSGLFYLFIIIPSISVGVRRMHDVGKSGWWILFPIVNFVLTVTSGEDGENQYGPESYI